MKQILASIIAIVIVICSLPAGLTAQTAGYQHGSVVRMRMGDCILASHRFMATFGGPTAPMGQDACPEYTLVAQDVVYVIVGKLSNQLIPLAETITFRLHKNEFDVRVDDAKKEIRFSIKEMIVRAEWERVQRHIDEQLRAAEVRPTAQ